MEETKTVDLEFNELAKLVAKKKKVTLFTKNGFQIRGVIEDYDNNVILVKTENDFCMVYRTALSTIALSGVQK